MPDASRWSLQRERLEQLNLQVRFRNSAQPGDGCAVFILLLSSCVCVCVCVPLLQAVYNITQQSDEFVKDFLSTHDKVWLKIIP